MQTVRTVIYLSLALAALAVASANARADKPSEIRIAFPGVGSGNRPFVGGHSTAVLHLKGMLEEEFRKDGIKVTWTFLRGAGPAVNELYANGLVDFSLLGDLPSIVGRASGLETKVLAATSIRGNTYLAVPSDSAIQGVKDLKGKRVAIFKGTNLQLSVAKILEAHGLREQDIKAINMDQASARAALITKDVDAVFGDYSYFQLRDQGVARIVYSTLGDPRYLRHCSFIGSASFVKQYPEIAKRVVKQLVLAAKWISENEGAPTQIFQLWAKSGFPYSTFKEDNKGQSLKLLASPLVDPYLTAQYKQQITDAKRFGLIKNGFEFDSWVDLRPLTAALKELGLENYWEPIGVSGKPTRVAAAQPAAASTATAALAQ